MLYLYDKIPNNQDLFANKVIRIANELNLHPDNLMFPMYFESKLSPTAINPITKAVGLIQFMSDTAKSLGTSTEKLKQMTNVQQLDYVYKYLLPYKGRIKTMVDVYFAIFFPLAIGKPRDFVLETKTLSRSKIALQNPVFDKNRNGEITVGEVEDTLLSMIPNSITTISKKKE